MGCGADEWFGIGVCLGDEAIDGGLSSRTDRNTPRLRRRRVSLAKKPSTALSQDAEVGVKWNVHRGCRRAILHLRMLVGGIVVDDGVDDFSGRDLLLDGVEEANELLVAMALHAAADDGAVEDVEGCEQRGGAVAVVVMGHRSGMCRASAASPVAYGRAPESGSSRRSRRRPRGRAGRCRGRRRLSFLGEFRIVRSLERADAVRRQSVGFENTLHRAQAHAHGFRQLRPVQWVGFPAVRSARSTTFRTVPVGSG